MSLRLVAKLLQVPVSTASWAAAKAGIKPAMVGRTWLLTPDEILALADELRKTNRLG